MNKLKQVWDRERLILRLKSENRALKRVVQDTARNHWLTQAMVDEIGVEMGKRMFNFKHTSFYGNQMEILVRVLDEPASPMSEP